MEMKRYFFRIKRRPPSSRTNSNEFMPLAVSTVEKWPGKVEPIEVQECLTRSFSLTKKQHNFVLNLRFKWLHSSLSIGAKERSVSMPVDFEHCICSTPSHEWARRLFAYIESADEESFVFCGVWNTASASVAAKWSVEIESSSHASNWRKKSFWRCFCLAMLLRTAIDWGGAYLSP